MVAAAAADAIMDMELTRLASGVESLLLGSSAGTHEPSLSRLKKCGRLSGNMVTAGNGWSLMCFRTSRT